MTSQFNRIFRGVAKPHFNAWFGFQVQLSNSLGTIGPFTARRKVVAAKNAATETATEQRQYLLPVKHVIVGGQRVKPVKGWRVLDGDEIFEIQPPDDSSPAVVPVPASEDWLVHTKRVA